MPDAAAHRARTPILALALAALTAAGGTHAAPAACAVLPAAEASSAIGARLASNVRRESRPTASNGHDHHTLCGWFPAGYDIAKADAPPPHGVQLSLHALRNPADAKKFHGLAVETTQERAKATGGKVATPSGAGEAALVETRSIGGVQVATLHFVKGSVAAQIQVWSREGRATDTATSLARMVASRI
jgi:hypothetical protein